MGVLDSFSLAGRISVVTGAARGIGRALALALAEAGSDVAVVVRTPSSADDLVAEIEKLGVRALAVTADVTDPDQVAAAADQITDGLGPVDILVNNAGVGLHKAALDLTPEEVRHILNVNIDGVWNCAQAFGRGMVARRSGSIVNIGSISGVIVNRPQWQPAYNASKAAVHQLTKSLAAEWGPYGVRVNALAPGYVKTEMAPVDDPKFKPRWVDDAPLQRYALPEELGPTVVYLASDAASFMTGSVVILDGGYSVY
ncbi:SDR family oxidoreductase [Microlunatus sp. Gsoil 973]|uniref:SDR family oxidoreductase n=1 Tax=Microlunatus sp. Gsoil 973 TaxID=2672569 RepID=UPI0012B4E35D|nr:SDR family oxidoreductase [Microlunatus sp. Gsoil 973]QGN31885.1 SDR family oxidoreductase [Microlunatus sp. Gsoil 973]